MPGFLGFNRAANFEKSRTWFVYRFLTGCVCCSCPPVNFQGSYEGFGQLHAEAHLFIRPVNSDNFWTCVHVIWLWGKIIHNHSQNWGILKRNAGGMGRNAEALKKCCGFTILIWKVVFLGVIPVPRHANDSNKCPPWNQNSWRLWKTGAESL